jgi:hypothetical protein
MKNGRCRLHGGKSTGPKTKEGITRIGKARTIHGRHSQKESGIRAVIRDLSASLKKLEAEEII